jgi:lysozyme
MNAAPDRERLRAQLIRHEAIRLKPYVDTVGKLTIGVGRNLDDVGLSEDEALYLLSNDLDQRIRALIAAYPWFVDLDPARQAVLVDMAFMGLAKLAGFTRMLAAFARKDYDDAAAEMLHSRWATQVGHRAIDLARQTISGVWQPTTETPAPLPFPQGPLIPPADRARLGVETPTKGHPK